MKADDEKGISLILIYIALWKFRRPDSWSQAS